jgi:hypothetical protein
MYNWLASDAYNDGVEDGIPIDGTFIPLDEQMGAGHLNVTRAIQQFTPGEYEAESGDVPTIGWDYGATTGQNDFVRYPLAGALSADHFISITLAWDRQVQFTGDADMDNRYDVGDTFEPSTSSEPDSDEFINDLDIYLLPKGSFDFTQAIAQSTGIEGTLEHIFFQIPTTDEYEKRICLQGKTMHSHGGMVSLRRWRQSTETTTATRSSIRKITTFGRSNLAKLAVEQMGMGMGWWMRRIMFCGVRPTRRGVVGWRRWRSRGWLRLLLRGV